MAIEGYGFKGSELKALYEPMLDGGFMDLSSKGGLGMAQKYGAQPALDSGNPAPKKGQAPRI